MGDPACGQGLGRSGSGLLTASPAEGLVLNVTVLQFF